MTKRRLYIFSLWVATCSVLLSTIILHHHHYNRICFIEEKCVEDGNVNDEHTHHHEKEQEGCSIHQMHHFLANAKIVKDIHQHITDGASTLIAITPSYTLLVPFHHLVITKWQEKTYPLSTADRTSIKRRGPPSLS